jgi:putative nucleotidyltransferase with HDIG domain
MAMENREYTILRKDGSTFPALVSGKATKGMKGEVTGVVVISIDISERKAAQKKTIDTLKKMEQMSGEIIAAISALEEMRDPYTAGHQRHVSQLAFAIAQELGLPAEQSKGIRFAGLLHDIGKLYVPTEILARPGKLSQIEFEVIKMHPQSGYEILRRIEFPWPVAEVAYQHQERLDGSGYPRNLRGDQILPETRIVSVADTIEAMTFHRPYRPELGLEKALHEIEQSKGRLYDEAAANACLRLFREKRFSFED